MQFIASAHAQTKEAIQGAVDAGNVLLQYQVLGAFCVFLILGLIGAGFIIRRQYNDNQALHNSNWQRFEKALVVIEASTAALVESRNADQALSAAINVLGKAVDELSHESEKHDSEVRHGLGGVSSRLDAVYLLLEKLREQIGGALERPRQGGSR